MPEEKQKFGRLESLSSEGYKETAPENTEAQEKLNQTSAEVAESASEIIEGAEKPRESQEKSTEDKAGQAHAGAVQDGAQSKLPPETEAAIQSMSAGQLRTRIRKEYEKEVKRLEKRAFWMGLIPARFAEDKLNETVAQIRELRKKINELIEMTLEKLRELYHNILIKRTK